MQWYKFQSCMMICFWQNTFWAKTSLSFVFSRSKLCTPWGFQACQSQWYKFQSCMMICFWENTFWAKTSLYFVLSRSKHSVYPDVFRHANHNGQVSKLYDDLFLTKTHFGLKHHFLLYSEGQTQCTLRFSGVLLPMVQVSKLYDDPFLRKHILG